MTFFLLAAAIMAVSILLLHRIAIFFGCPIRYKSLILCAVMAFLVNFVTLNISPFLTPMHYGLILLFVLAASLGVTFYNARLVKTAPKKAAADIRGDPANTLDADKQTDEKPAEDAPMSSTIGDAPVECTPVEETADEINVDEAAEKPPVEEATETTFANEPSDTEADETPAAKEPSADEPADEMREEEFDESAAEEQLPDASAAEADDAAAKDGQESKESAAALTNDEPPFDSASEEPAADETTLDEAAEEPAADETTLDEAAEGPATAADNKNAVEKSSADDAAKEPPADETSDEPAAAAITTEPVSDDEEDPDIEPAVLPSEEERQRAKEELKELTEAVGRLHSLDDYLDYADQETRAQRYRRAIFAYKQALGIYWNDDYAPFIAINLSNTYRDVGDYKAAVDTYEAALTLPATQKNAAMQQEFQRSADYLRTMQDILANHGIAAMPFAQIPPEISAEIESVGQKA